MSKLGIFVDESGNFDLKSVANPFYIFTLVFHNHDKSISNDIKVLEQRLASMNFKKRSIHTYELIRREKEYLTLTIDERKNLFNQLFYFTRKVPIKFQSFYFEKRQYVNKIDLQVAMAKKLGIFIKENYEYFLTFDSITVYYDNGQYEITELLSIVVKSCLSNVVFKKVRPVDYRLFQSADLLCTLELLHLKYPKSLSNSEKHFFKREEIKKTYLKGINKIRF